MTELKVFLSAYNNEDFYEEVSGITFDNSREVVVHTFDSETTDLSGIQEGVRKNILLPFNKNTRNFFNSQNLKNSVAPAPKKEEAAKEEKEEEVKQEVVMQEVKEEVKEPSKKTRKRTTKKEESN